MSEPERGTNGQFKVSSTHKDIRRAETLKRQNEFLKVLAENYFNVGKSLDDAQLSRHTYNGWLKTSDFRERRDILREKMTDALEQVGWQIAVGSHPASDGKPHPDMVKFFLKSLHPDFHDTKHVEVSGSVDHIHREFEGWSQEKLEHYASTGEEIEDAEIEEIESSK